MRRHPSTPTTALLLLALLATAGCGSEKASNQDGRTDKNGDGQPPAAGVTTEPSPEPLTGTVWTVTGLTAANVTEDLPAGAEKAAHFTLGADGTLSGSLGCNRFTARAQDTGSALTLGPVAGTKMLCDGGKGAVEQHLLKVLAGKVGYAVDGRTAVLTGPDGTGLRATAD
ncbi:META domain-containing protein [Streptomyces qinzhouensis]|uniref:META domain-containing protein n=1 Tax=Streptomyces qinzhouensis TaxID=2599401 RepID=A0A5B8JJH3_9ACTN|nr:META domain-containing protein [Streptomyces qinzhouensis]QDY77693.1 META domain-containing protein [Streptomyces qinzhouensis]